MTVLLTVWLNKWNMTDIFEATCVLLFDTVSTPTIPTITNFFFFNYYEFYISHYLPPL